MPVFEYSFAHKNEEKYEQINEKKKMKRHQIRTNIF